MSGNCTEIQKAMDELFEAAPDAARADALLDHIDGCAACAAHYELLGRLRGATTQEPDDASLLAMRRGVLRAIRSGDAPSPGWLDRLRAALATPLFATGLAAVVVVGAFVAGRATQKGATPAPDASLASAGDVIVDEIQLVASKNRGLADVENSPFSYDNVELRDAGNGKLALRFDVSRHVDVVLPKNDPLVADVLAQSLLDQAPVGTKLRALSWAAPAMSPKVREALVRTMLEDSNLGVRMKAQEMLVVSPGDTAVEEALLTVLQKEESVQMRLVAIDYLTRSNVAPEKLREAVEPREPSGGVDAVYVKAMDYVNSK